MKKKTLQNTQAVNMLQQPKERAKNKLLQIPDHTTFKENYCETNVMYQSNSSLIWSCSGIPLWGSSPSAGDGPSPCKNIHECVRGSGMCRELAGTEREQK